MNEGRERLFVALPLPDEVRMAVAEWRSVLGLPGTLVPPENLHVTLRFIGDVDDVGRDRILAELDQADLPAPFSFRVCGIGGFPGLRKATVGWAGLEAADGVFSDLAGVVEEAVVAAGHDYDDRPYRPHLTLARIRPPADLSSLAAVEPLGARVAVTGIVLYRTRFAGAGVVYESVERFSL